MSNRTSSSIPAEPPLERLSAGNVLLVVEIAASSLGYDMGRKAALYVDAVKLMTRVFREPYETGYADARDFAASGLLSSLLAPPAFALRLGELQLI
jgi:hypothetical protein